MTPAQRLQTFLCRRSGKPKAYCGACLARILKVSVYQAMDELQEQNRFQVGLGTCSRCHRRVRIINSTIFTRGETLDEQPEEEQGDANA